MTAKSVEIRGMEFTPQQAEAVQTLDQNLVINAGAGSGKTRVLTERYIEILLTEESKGGLMYCDDALERIVAITFTRKAATEMKQRIRQRLEGYLADNFVTLEQCKQEWLFKILDNLSQARISTIHSFCSDILRNNLFNLGLSSDFQIIEGVEEQKLQQEAIRLVIDEIKTEEGHPLHKKLRQLLYRYGKEKLYKVLADMLAAREMINKFVAERELARITEETDELVYQANLQAIEKYLKDEDLEAMINKISTYTPQEETEASQVVAQVIDLYHELTTAWQHYQSDKVDKAELFELHLEFLNSFETTSVYRKWKASRDEKSEVNNLFKDIRAKVLEIVPTEGSGRDKEVVVKNEGNYELVKWLVEIYQLIDEKYHQLKEEEGYLDFLDLEERVVKAFDRDYELVERLREEIDFIMVDEFQDTNQTQWDIIRPLVTQDENYTELATDKLFIVGDPKQSIYGFRRADVRIFNQITEQIMAGNGIDSGKLIKFKKNFRSNREIIDFINHSFANILPENKDEAEEYDVAYQELTFGRDNKYGDKIDSNPDSHLEVLITEKPDQEDDYSSKEYEAKLIADKIQWLVEESDKKIFKNDSLELVDYEDIAILMKTRTRLKEYEAALDKAGIPYRTVKGKGFYQRREVYDLYLTLKALVYPEDDLNAYGLLRSPFFEFSDDELFSMMINVNEEVEHSLLEEVVREYPEVKAKFDKWQQLKEETSLDQLITTILIDCGAYGSCQAGSSGQQRLANFQKLIEEAAEFTYEQGNSLYRFLERLETLMEEEDKEGEAEVEIEEGNFVKLMTIHAAKGKEFPVVLLANLNHGGRPITDYCICDEIAGREEIGIKYYTGELKQEKTSSYSLIKERLEHKEEMEGKRIFYVGTTRAEEMLLLSGVVNINSNDEIKLHHSMKWLMQGLDYREQDLKDFLEGEEKERIEELADKIEVKLTLNELDITGEKEKEEFIEVGQKLTAETKPEKLKIDLPSIHPSQLTKEETAAVGVQQSSNEISLLDDKRSTLKGTLVHKAIEILASKSELDRDYLFNAHPEHKDYPGLRSEVEEVIDRLQSCSQFNEILEHECQPEVEFYFKNDANQPLSGSIDLVYYTSNECCVVDWKTNRVNNQQDIELLTEKYRPQIEMYQEVVGKMTGKERIKGYLYFTEVEAGERLVEVK